MLPSVSQLVTLLSLGAADAPAGQVPRAQLEYVREAGAEDCPDERRFRESVAARLGYWPFDPASTKMLRVRMEPREGELRGSVKMEEPEGTLVGERELRAAAGDCRELASAVELAVTIAIDPLTVSRPAPGPAPEEVAPPAPAILEPEIGPPPPATTSLEWSAWAGPSVTFGVAPATAFGVKGGVAARVGSASFGVEGGVDLPSSSPWKSGRVETSLTQAGLSGCLHLNRFAACAVGAGGVLAAAGEGFQESRRVSGPWAAAGVRALAEVPLSGVVSVRFSAEGLATLLRPQLRVDGQEAWVTPPVVAGAGAAVLLHFP